MEYPSSQGPHSHIIPALPMRKGRRLKVAQAHPGDSGIDNVALWLLPIPSLGDGGMAPVCW